jgi:hypothetical protein
MKASLARTFFGPVTGCPDLTMLPVPIGCFFVAGFFLSLTAFAYFVSCKILSASATRVRAVATFANLIMFQGWAFYLLMAVRCFNTIGAALVAIACVAGALALWRSPAVRATAASDLANVNECIAELKQSPWVWPILLGVLTAGIVMLHGMLLPPIAYDSLTHQALRPALWVQAGGPETYHAPGPWLLFSTRFPLGNSLTAWSMLPHHSDVLVPVAWGAVWAALVLGTYAIARELAASRPSAALAAITTGLIPSLAVHMTTALVDNLVGALVLAASVLLIALERERNPVLGAQAITTLACSFAVKTTGAPFFILGSILCCFLLYRCPRGSGRLRALLWGATATLLLIVPFQAYLWHTTGNPLYPYPLKLGDHVVFQRGQFADGLSPHGRLRPWAQKLSGMFLDGYLERFDHINAGPALALVASVAPWAAFRLIRAKRQPICSFVLSGIFAAAFVFVPYSPTGSGLNEMRYVAAALAFFCALIATLDTLWVRAVLCASLVVHLFYRAAFHWGAPDTTAVALFAVLLLPFVAGALLSWRRALHAARGNRWVGLLLSAIIAWSPVAVALPPLKERFRHDIYQAAQRGWPREDIPMVHPSFFVGTMFRTLDDPEHPLRLAVTAGWDQHGINWFTYPLLGSRFQNSLSYVPPSQDGSLPAYVLWQPYTETGDYATWRQRIVDGRYDYVVTLAPRTLELQWMEQHPEHFQLVYVPPSEYPGSSIYRVINN